MITLYLLFEKELISETLCYSREMKNCPTYLRIPEYYIVPFDENFRIHIIYFKSGVWVYPVMEVLTLPLRMVFILVMLTVCMILYFVGEELNNLVWGNEHTKHQKSHIKSK